MHSCSNYTFSLSLAVRNISKDGPISCECADFTAAVPLPVDVQCELILSAAAFFDFFCFV